MAPEYIVQVANGVYMGSDGSFSAAAPAGVPIIESTKFQVPVDPAKVKQWRHSSFRIPIATQLTYVPQSFLDAEGKLADEANDFWRGLVTKYVEVGELSPEDPVAQLGKASLRSAEQRLALFTAAQKHAPELLAQHLREHGLKY